MNTPRPATPTAAILVIGNEILSGRTQDANVLYIAKKLTEVGVRVSEVRIVPDIETDIVVAVNALRQRYAYVFSTGGIGATHDDITAASMAKAFGVTLVEHPEARERLTSYYTPEKLTQTRLLMARVPQGAELIDNPSTVAPGFRFENVFVMAGVPSIMQGMMDGILGKIKHGPSIHSLTITCALSEGMIAKELGEIAARYADLDIGSYPSFRIDNMGVALVVRGTDLVSAHKAADEITALVREKGGVPKLEAA